MYWELVVTEVGPLRGMTPDMIATELRKKLTEMMPHGSIFAQNLVIVANMALAESKLNGVLIGKKNPIGMPFLFLAANKQAARAAVRVMSVWSTDGLELEFKKKTLH